MSWLSLLLLALRWGPSIISLVLQIIELIQKLPSRDQGNKVLELHEAIADRPAARLGSGLSRIERLRMLKRDVRVMVARHEKSL